MSFRVFPQNYSNIFETGQLVYHLYIYPSQDPSWVLLKIFCLIIYFCDLQVLIEIEMSFRHTVCGVREYFFAWVGVSSFPFEVVDGIVATMWIKAGIDKYHSSRRRE